MKKTNKKKLTKETSVGSNSNHLIEVPNDASGLRAALGVLGDKTQAVDVRREALRAIQAASFSVLEFGSIRPDYIATLREVAKDNDYELRQSALGVLSRVHDGFAQKVLLEGLQDPSKALVVPEKALQLLSYDPHSAAYSIARDVLKTSSNEPARQEAIYLLSRDPQSIPLLEKVLTNKNESNETRRIAATALHALHPEKLQKLAHKSVADSSENDDVVATCLTALHHFGDSKTIAADKALQKRLNYMQTKASPKVRQLAKQCAEKHGI